MVGYQADSARTRDCTPSGTPPVSMPANFLLMALPLCYADRTLVATMFETLTDVNAFSPLHALARKGYKQLENAGLNFTAGQIFPGHFQHHSCVASLL